MHSLHIRRVVSSIGMFALAAAALIAAVFCFRVGNAQTNAEIVRTATETENIAESGTPGTATQNPARQTTAAASRHTRDAEHQKTTSRSDGVSVFLPQTPFAFSTTVQRNALSDSVSSFSIRPAHEETTTQYVNAATHPAGEQPAASDAPSAPSPWNTGDDTAVRTTVTSYANAVPSVTAACPEAETIEEYIAYSKGRFFVPDFQAFGDTHTIDMPLVDCEAGDSPRVLSERRAARFDGSASGLGTVFCGHQQYGMLPLIFLKTGQTVYADGKAYTVTDSRNALNDGAYLTDCETGKRITTTQPIAYTCAPKSVCYEYQEEQVPYFYNTVAVVFLEPV